MTVECQAVYTEQVWWSKAHIGDLFPVWLPRLSCSLGLGRPTISKWWAFMGLMSTWLWTRLWESPILTMPMWLAWLKFLCIGPPRMPYFTLLQPYQCCWPTRTRMALIIIILLVQWCRIGCVIVGKVWQINCLEPLEALSTHILIASQLCVWLPKYRSDFYSQYCIVSSVEQIFWLDLFSMVSVCL